MKRVIALLLALTLLLVSAAALAEAPEDENSFLLTLTGNPSTGYEWKYVVSEEGLITVEEEFLNSADIDKLAGIEPSAELMAGEPGFYIYTVKGVKPGELLLAFEYAQVPDGESDVGLTYSLRVNEDLSVVCTGCMMGM